MAQDNLNGRLEDLIKSVANVINSMPPLDDAASDAGSLWSAAKIMDFVNTQLASVAKTDDGLAAQIGQLSTLLQTDGNALAALQSLLNGQAAQLGTVVVRVDEAQSFTPAQQAQALANLGLSAAAFFVDEDLAALFASKLKNPAYQAAATAGDTIEQALASAQAAAQAPATDLSATQASTGS